MENIALSDETVVLEGNKKYFELESSQHTEDFRALTYGKGNMLTQAIGNVFDLSKLKPNGIYIEEYKNNKLASALRFSDESFLTPVDHKCGSLCALVGNEENSTYNVQKKLLKRKKSLTVPVDELNFIKIRDLKHEIKEQDIVIKRDDYERAGFLGISRQPKLGIPNYFVYESEESSTKHCFDVPISVLIMDKIYKKLGMPAASSSEEKIIEENILQNEIDIMFHSLKKSQTRVEGYISGVDSVKHGSKTDKINIPFMIISLQKDSEGRVFRCPFSHSFGLSFLDSNYMWLKKHMEITDLRYIT